MKTFKTMTAILALFAGMSLASAQHAPTTTPNPSPNSINKGSRPSTPSGSESQAAANSGSGMANKKVTGSAKFCAEQGQGGSLKCTYKTMASCHAANKANGWTCVQNPSRGTTGSK
jgi:hypothetical protein